MMTKQTGWFVHPLSSQNGGDNPTPTAGAETTFALKSIPKVKNKQAVYLYGLSVLIKGDLVQAGGTGVRQYLDNFIRLIVASFSVRSAFHGTPVNTQWYLGAFAHVIEFVSNGYRKMSRSKGAFPAANGTYPFSVRVFVPLACGLGPSPHHTAQLALLYDDAVFGFNMAAASVLTAASPGATFANVSLRVSAYCGLEREIRLGPCYEIVDYTATSVAAANQEIMIPDFGNKSGLEGVERSAGIVWANLVGSLNGCPGPVDVSKITRFSAPWRNQIETSDPSAYFDMAVDAQGPNRLVGSTVDTGGAAGSLYDFSGYPFIMGATGGIQRTQELDDGIAFGFPVVSPAYDLYTSKVQTVGEAVSMYVTCSANPSAGQWHLLTGQLKRWTPQKREEFVALVVKSGLGKDVLGSGLVEWKDKTLSKMNPANMDPRKVRYLPKRLKLRQAA